MSLEGLSFVKTPAAFRINKAVSFTQDITKRVCLR